MHAKILSEFRMRHQGIINLLWRVTPLDASVKAFGVLTENHHVNLRFLNSSIAAAADKIERVAFVGKARAHADIQSEMLAKANDWTCINQVFFF